MAQAVRQAAVHLVLMKSGVAVRLTVFPLMDVGVSSQSKASIPLTPMDAGKLYDADALSLLSVAVFAQSA